MGNEEEQAEEVEEIKKNEDFKGKIHYRLEYDFTTQELKVTVGVTLTHGRRNCKDTPVPKCRLFWCFSLGWCSNFVGVLDLVRHSVKPLQNMVYNTTQHPPPPPPTVTLCLCTVLEFLNNLWGLGTKLEQGCCTGPPGYKGWRN